MASIDYLFIQFEISLVLGIKCDSQLKPRHLEYYKTRTYLNLLLYLASFDTTPEEKGGHCLIVTSWGQKSRPLLNFHCHLRGVCVHFYYCWWGWESWLPFRLFDTSLAGRCRNTSLLLPMWPLQGGRGWGPKKGYSTLFLLDADRSPNSTHLPLTLSSVEVGRDA